jgi:hypothetical protein
MKKQLFAAGHTRSAAVGALTLVALSTAAHAQLLNGGAPYFPGSGSTAPTDTITYTLQATAQGTYPGGQLIGAVGTVTEWVFKAVDSGPSNPGTTMDYFFQVTDTNGAEPIKLFSAQFISPTTTILNGFAFQTGIGLPTSTNGTGPFAYQTGTTVPLYLDDSNGNEFDAAFQVSISNFSGTLGPGGGNQTGPVSVLFGFTTPNLNIGPATVSVTEGGTANFSNFFLPVPEPSAPIFGFAVLGVIGVGMMRRFKGSKTSTILPVQG